MFTEYSSSPPAAASPALRPPVAAMSPAPNAAWAAGAPEEEAPQHAVEGLDMSAVGLRVLAPSALAVFRHITSLQLQNNRLADIPPDLADALPLLTVLDLSHNELSTLPWQITKLLRLQRLSLSHNKFSLLPWDLGKLRCSQLQVDHNPITNVPPEMLSPPEQLIKFLRDQAPTPPPAPDRQWLFHQPASGDTLSVICYNVLAESYATESLYYHTPAWALAWDYRRRLIMNELLKAAADVVCLQEVETEQFASFFQPELAAAGYQGVFRPKSRAKTMDASRRAVVDGVAVFFRQDKYRIVDEVLVEFSALATSRPEFQGAADALNRLHTKDNVALVVVLERDGEMFLVANVHIHWSPAFADVKALQTQLLLEECTRLSSIHGGGDGLPLVVMGDFNSLPDSAVYQLIREGNLSASHPDLASRSYGAYSERGLHHPLHLESAYGALTGEPAFTNFTAEFTGTLDYIWYSVETMSVAAVLELPEAEGIRRELALPSPQYPSDHILLGAVLQFGTR